MNNDDLNFNRSRGNSMDDDFPQNIMEFSILTPTQRSPRSPPRSPPRLRGFIYCSLCEITGRTFFTNSQDNYLQHMMNKHNVIDITNFDI